MKKILIFLAVALHCIAARASSSLLKMDLVNTASAETVEGLLIKGGSYFKTKQMTHPAFFITHDQDIFLFDTGYGQNAKRQVEKDLNWFFKFLTKFTQITTAKEWADKNSIKIKNIFLSHIHFDHASGLQDFPDSKVWLTKKEFAYIEQGKPPAVLPSVFNKNIQWNILELSDVNYEGFEQSLDLYRDGSVVFVPLPGHTPGSIGLFLNFNEENRVFLVGDSVWSYDSIRSGVPKSFIGRKFGDFDADVAEKTLHKIIRLQKSLPNLLIVPNHDPEAVEKLNALAKKIR